MTNEPEWMKTLEDLWWGSFDEDGEKNPNEYEKMISFIQDTIKEEKEKAKAELLSKIEEEVEKYKVFEPTCGYESEEENGFQKGLAAGEKLMKKEILLSLSKYKVNK